MQAKIKKELRGFVDENFLFGQGAQSLGGDDSFLEKGIIDSTGVLELVNLRAELRSRSPTRNWCRDRFHQLPDRFMGAAESNAVLATRGAA
jgi:hypothetical protein